MKKNARGMLLILGLVSVFPLNKASGGGCGQSSPTVTNLPATDTYSYQVNGLNAAGQLAGFFNANGSFVSHAFLYSAGSVMDLGTLGGNISEGFALNNSGYVAGDSQFSAGDPGFHAALSDGTNLFDLGTLGGSFSSASALNDSGQVVGASYVAGDGSFDAFMFSNGTMLNLGDFGGGYSSAFAINNNGVVVGESATTNGDIHGFVYSSGVLVDVGTLGGNYSSAFSVNSSGAVAGEAATTNGDTHGFVLIGSVLQDVGTFGGTFSSAFKVNDAGQTIGVATTANDAEAHGFLFSGGTLLDLGSFGGLHTYPSDINNLGQVVGSSEGTDGNSRAFLWQNGTMVDLNGVVPADSGWVLESASFINDTGRIVGAGSLNGIWQPYILDLTSVNRPPVAVAGGDQTVECQTQVTLNGGQSSDPDGDVLAYEWSSAGYLLGTNSILTGYFGLGTNLVSLKVSDPCGAFSVASVTVIVRDTALPTIVAPALVEVSAGNNCQVAVPDISTLISVSDNCSSPTDLKISQNPAAGASAGVGQNPIQVTVTDLAGNVATATIVLQVVDKTAPVVISAPGPLTIAAGSDCHGIVPDVRSQVATTDNCTPGNQLVVVQTPAAGTSVDKGQHTITVTVTDAAGNAAAVQVSLTVVDTTPPTIVSAPGPLTVSAGSDCHGIVPDVLSQIAATDNCTPGNQLVVVQNPAAGTSVDKGQHTIAVTVTDAAGNAASVQVSLTVVDTTLPTIVSAPGPLTVAAGSDCHGIVPDVLSQIAATDNCTPGNQLVVVQNPVAGTSVDKGQHTIVVIVTDAAGNAASVQVSLTVVDTTPPTIVSAPGPLTVAAGSDCHGIVPDVLSQIAAADNCTPGNQLVVVQNPVAGTSVDKGQHTIAVTVTDAAGNAASVQIPLSVVDRTAPVIQNISVSPNVLSPPNHQMVPVTVSVSATDNCDSAPVSKIISITSNEAVQPSEIVITGQLTASLAATRNGASGGRIYTLTVQCTDNSGNSSLATVTVTVPQGTGKK